MPKATIPLVGSYNERSIDGSATLVLNKDQRFLNCTFNLVQNAITGKATLYVEKRPGWTTSSLVSAGNASTGLIQPQSMNAAIIAFGDINSTVYYGTTNVGTITGRALHFTETLISNVGYVAIKSSDGTGWYYAKDSHQVTAYTMDGNNSTTVTDIKIGGVNSTAGLYPGQLLTAASNITAGTRVVSVNAGAFTAVLDTATTGGAFNDLAVTKEPIAKIIDADFMTTGTHISGFAALDGYLFYATDDGYVNNSDLNSISAYSANARIAAQQAPDPTIAVAVQKGSVIAFGLASTEKFQNAGFQTAPLKNVQTQMESVGALNQRSITTIEDDIYFVSSPSEGDVGVYRMRNWQSTRVSTPNVDRIIGTIAITGGAIYASSFRLGGYVYATFFLSTASDVAYALLLENSDYILLENGDNILLEDAPGEVTSFARLMVYNATLNVWSEWDGTLATFIDSVSSGSTNQLVATSRVNTSGKVYSINPTSDGELYEDDGSAYTMEIRTSKVDFGSGRRKFIESVELLGADSSAGNTPYLSYSDDDYRSWSDPRPFSTSGERVILYRCGSHKGGRAYKITDASDAPFRAQALAIEYREAAF